MEKNKKFDLEERTAKFGEKKQRKQGIFLEWLSEVTQKWLMILVFCGKKHKNSH